MVSTTSNTILTRGLPLFEIGNVWLHMRECTCMFGITKNDFHLV